MSKIYDTVEELYGDWIREHVADEADAEVIIAELADEANGRRSPGQDIEDVRQRIKSDAGYRAPEIAENNDIEWKEEGGMDQLLAEAELVRDRAREQLDEDDYRDFVNEVLVNFLGETGDEELWLSEQLQKVQESPDRA